MKYSLSELAEIVQNRRTITPEQFSDRKVHKEQIEALLESARWAPTHKLTQPWYFKVFMGEGLTKFGEWHSETYKSLVSAEDFNEKKYNMMKTRPQRSSAIIVVAMKRDTEERIPEIEELAAVSCAVQNMHLTATAYGLAFYWGTGGLTYKPAMREFIGLGENDKVLGLLHVGYPAKEWPRKTPRKPIEYFTDWVTE